jgi:hypothetical protein
MSRAALGTDIDLNTGEYFQNRGLFSDYFLRDRLREDPAWRDNPSELLAFVRDLLCDAQSRWGGKDKETLRNQLLEPLFKKLGFKPVVNRPSKKDLTQADYMLKSYDNGKLTAAFVYAWDRWLDGPDLNDADTPEVNPGARVVTALDLGIGDWIIVTNGRLWRLYSRQAHGRATNFYEVDLADALTASGDTDPNEAFRYWSLFFRSDAFTPIAPLAGRGDGGQGCAPCWLDGILEGSQEYAKRLEERLKERIFVTIFPHLAQGFLMDRNQRLHSLPSPSGTAAGVEGRGAGGLPTEAELAHIFEATLTFLYRLLFLFYAESRDLLPTQEAPYHAASLKKIQEEIANKAGVAESGVAERLYKAFSAKETTLYDRLGQLFRAMDKGDPILNVPTYNGGLFNTTPPPSPSGRGDGGEGRADAWEGEGSRQQRIARFLLEHKVPDRHLALAIDRLARDQDERTLELVFIDYKSLEVRHLGSIYEGLLEFKLKVADEDLTTQADKKGEKYIPLSKFKRAARRKPADVVVRKKEVYLSNDKAERKASGSYYTPDPIVEYIVANTVGPVLDEKLEALRGEFRKARKTFDNELQKSHAYPSKEVKSGKLDHRQWAGLQTYDLHKELVERLFNLRMLDPAMGSGHFLVEAVDFLTDRLLIFLNQFPINPVNFALNCTRASILECLGQQGVTVDPAKLTDINLLKRHILKRCIYGVDLNPMAVELAKVSLWLDAFTLGAPLSFLDHHLRCGNSLIGASFKELEAATAPNLKGHRAMPESVRLTCSLDYQPLLQAINHVLFVSGMADATAVEVATSSSRYDQARQSLAAYQVALDFLIARHLGLSEAKHFVESDGDLKLTGRDRFYATLRNEEERKLVAQVETLAKRPDLCFFHWEIEFPEVFFSFVDFSRRQIKHKDMIEAGSAGFDCVVGNPPYSATLDEHIKKCLTSLLPLTKSNPDTAVAFIEKAMSLVATSGRIGFIVPKPLTYSFSWRQTRAFLFGKLREIADVSRAWRDVLLEQMVFIAQKGKLEKTYIRRTLEGAHFSLPRALQWDWAKRFDTIPCSLSDRGQQILESLELDGSTVGEVCKTFRGLGLQGRLHPDGKIPVIGGRDLERWGLRSASGFLEENGIVDLDRFRVPKLLFQNIIAHVANPKPHIVLIGAYDEDRTVSLDTVNNIVSKKKGIDLFAILALLHSDFVNWFVYSVVFNNAIRTMHFDQYFLDKIPLPKGFDVLQQKLSRAARQCIQATRRVRELLAVARVQLTNRKPSSANRIVDRLIETATRRPSSPVDSDPWLPPSVFVAIEGRFLEELREHWHRRNSEMHRINVIVKSAYGASKYQDVFEL